MISLQHPYIAVQDGAKESFGGNQGWLRDCPGRAALIAKCGCGAVAAADLLLYLARYHGAATPLTAPLCAGKTGRKEYLDYLREVEREVARVMPAIGMTGFALAGALNRYFARHGICFRARWRALSLGGASVEEQVARSLRADLPAVLTIPGAWLRSRALRLYRQPPDLSRGDQADPLPATPYAAHCGHFVTATALAGQPAPYLVVSSWGRRYFLSLKEYADAAGRMEGLLVCGLLELRPVANPPRPVTIRIQL